MNKINEHPFDLNRRGLEQKYPFIRCFLRTDCDDRTGIDELRRTIERETDWIEHLRDAFPAAWFSIKDRLASPHPQPLSPAAGERGRGEGQNYLSFDQYRAIYREHNETDPAAQESLAFYLHSLRITSFARRPTAATMATVRAVTRQPRGGN